MVVTAKTEIIKGTNSTVQWNGPNDFTEIIVCKDCEGANFNAIELSAKTAAGLTTFGIAHATKTSYYLRKVRTELITPTDVILRATYRGYPSAEYRFEVFGALNAKTVNYDYNGDALTLTKPESLSDDNEADYYIEDAIALMPQTVVRMVKIGFSGPSWTSAINDSVKYTGYLNSNYYLGEKAGKWLCTKYSLINEGAGSGAYSGSYSWKRIVELQYDPNGWQITKSYRLSSGIVYYSQDENSEKTFNIYGDVNFPLIWYYDPAI